MIMYIYGLWTVTDASNLSVSCVWARNSIAFGRRYFLIRENIETKTER